jgi:WD40 repeat protein
VVVWDVETGDILFQLDLSAFGAAQDVSLSPDGEQLMAWTFDGVARVWAVGQEEPLVSLEVGLPNGPVQMSPDWGFIARLGKEGVAYKSVQTGKRGAVKMTAVDELGLEGFVWVQGGEALMMWDAKRYEVVKVATGALQSSGRHPGLSVKGVLLDEEALACFLTPVPGGELSTTPIKEGVKCQHDYLTPEAASQLGVVWSRSYTPPASVYQSATSLKGDHRAVAQDSGVIHLYDSTNNLWGLLSRTSQAQKHDRVAASDVVLVTKREQESIVSRHEPPPEESSVTIRSLDARCAQAICTDDGGVCVLHQCADAFHGALLVSDASRGGALTQIADPPSRIYDIAISPVADQLAIGTQDVILLGPVVQSSTPLKLRALPLSPGERAMQVMFSADGQTIWVATAGSTGQHLQRYSLDGARKPLFQLPDTEEITALERLPGENCLAIGLTGRIGRFCEGDIAPTLEPHALDDYPVTALHLAADGATLIVGSASGNRLVNAADLSTRFTLPTCGLLSPSVIVDGALTSAFLFNNSATCVVPLTTEAWRETLWEASDVCLTPDQRLSLGLGDAEEVEQAYQACLAQVNAPTRP